ARATAPAARIAVADEAWLLGRNDECGVLPRSGAVAAPADALHNLRVDFPGVIGGSSGAPLLTGAGIAGILKDSDNVTLTVHSLDDIARRVAAAGLAWTLADARNIPPTD